MFSTRLLKWIIGSLVEMQTDPLRGIISVVPTWTSYKRKPNSHSTESTVPVHKKVNVQEIFIERQRTKRTPSCFHVVVIEYKQISSTKSNQSRRQYPVDRLTRNYIPCLAAQPCIDHIWEFTPGGLSACFSYRDFVVQTSWHVDKS